MKEINVGYEIQSRVMVNETDSYVVGYIPKNEFYPYATWTSVKCGDEWKYSCGFYTDKLQSALNDLADRISYRKYEFDEPTQVIFKRGREKYERAGIAYHYEVFDGYDGEKFSLKDPYNPIEIIKVLPWNELDVEIGGESFL